MRKLKLYMAQSLDGFIATTEGGVEWLNEPESNTDPNAYGYLDFYQTIDTTLMGYNTYKTLLDFGIPFPYLDKKNYVFSRQHRKEDDNPVEFISSDPVEFVKKLKKEEGKDIWLIGGGQINRLLLNADLIDEIILFIKSVILGEGIAAFAHKTDLKQFTIENVQTFDGTMVQMCLNSRKH